MTSLMRFGMLFISFLQYSAVIFFTHDSFTAFTKSWHRYFWTFINCPAGRKYNLEVPFADIPPHIMTLEGCFIVSTWPSRFFSLGIGSSFIKFRYRILDCIFATFQACNNSTLWISFQFNDDNLSPNCFWKRLLLPILEPYKIGYDFVKSSIKHQFKMLLTWFN